MKKDIFIRIAVSLWIILVFTAGIYLDISSSWLPIIGCLPAVLYVFIIRK